MFRLLRTASFRFTLIYVLVFAGAVALLGAFIYQQTFGTAEQEIDRVIDGEFQVLAEVFASEGPAKLRQVVQDRAAWRDGGIYMLIAAPSGAPLAGNLTALPPEALTAEAGFFNFTFERPKVDARGKEAGVEIRQGRAKIRRFRASPEAENFFLVFVARDVSDRELLRERTRRLILQLAFATIALGLVIGLAFSHSLMRQVDAVNKTARQISTGDMTKRIQLTGAGDELENLAINLNGMLDKIERLMSGMKEVSDNIAHDLRSPLTRIRNRLTTALKADEAGKEEALRATLEESESMIGTFNALLSIARIESGESGGAMEPVDVVAIAQEMTELYEPAVQEAGFALALKAEATPPIRGSRALISQALANLLDNAMKYAAGGANIEISVKKSQKGHVRLAVADDGPGVPIADREHIFQRFVRLETSRTTQGSGLGLSLVAAIARAHGAALKVDGGGLGGAQPGLSIALIFPPRARA
ncbi:MAG: ATP-binding protein [Parvularculaceae bacterium]